MAAKKFDAVTILGLLLAASLFVGGNLYVRSQQEQARKEWDAAQAVERKRFEAEAAARPVEVPKLTAGTDPAGVKSAAADPAVVAAAARDAEPVKAKDIKVIADKLTLEFTAHGASVKRAVLNDAYIDSGAKERKPANKGLEILGEIEAGKLTGAIPTFEIGPVDSARQAERVVFTAVDGAQKALSQRVWKLESDSGTFAADGKRVIVYSTVLPQKYVVTKTYTVNKATYFVGIDVAVANNSETPVSWSYTLNGPTGIYLDGPPENPKGSPYVILRAELAGRNAPLNARQADAPDVITVDPATAVKGNEKSWVSREQNLWAAVKNRFFSAILISMDSGQFNKLSAVEIKNKTDDPDKRLIEPNVGVLGFRKTTGNLEPSKSGEPDRYALYIGPTNEGELLETEAQLQPAQPFFLVSAMQYCDIMNYRWPRVDWVASKLMWVFTRLYSFVGNYGICVILLTVLIKLALHPTQRKATLSMSRMQKLQPEVKKLQEKYKNQTTNEARMQMQREQMDLYKKAGVNPAGGCLPMLVQIPILSALYGIFNHAFEIRGAEFLWVKDLSVTDRLAMLPFWPYELNLLPILYLGLQLLQMKVAPQAPPSDDPAQEMNRKMMMYMPVFFTFMFYGMPSGLMIYFACSAVFSICETWYIRTYLINDKPAAPGGNAANAPQLRAAVASKGK
mgnify:CR=1 FL=1